MFRTLIVILFVLAAGIASNSHAQPSKPTPSPSPINSPTSTPPFIQLPVQHDRSIRMDSSANPSVALSHYEASLGWGVLVFGLIVIMLEIGVMLRLKKGWGLQSSRIVGITLVVVAGLFLIVTGYSQEQIAPMIGLLGTIIGFLLGKTTSDKEAD